VDPSLLESRSYRCGDLVRRHPPRFRNANKLAALKKALGPADVPAGTVVVSRWSGCALPARHEGRMPKLTERPGFFVYGEPLPPDTLAWHMNFAMSDCFGAYAGDLLAQDELQVLEHPALASVREAADAEGFSIVCAGVDGPTPVTVSGVERRGFLDTRPAPGRPRGLYGNEFARAPVAAVLAALTRLDPPPLSNILAIEAPADGEGKYSGEEIEHILVTATSGYRAARLASAALGRARTVIHTGFWGCGAYGGDHEIMSILQLLGASLAGVEELVFYSVDPGGAEVFARAKSWVEALPPGTAVAAVVERLEAQGYPWGDGNGT